MSDMGEIEQKNLAMVRLDGMALKSIENPSEAVQLAAVNQNWRATQYIKNPSDMVQIEAVKQHKNAIYKIIISPSESAVAMHLIYYPDSDVIPLKNNRIKILDSYLSGLSDVYTLARTMGYEGDELRDRLLAYIESARNPQGAPACNEFNPIDFDAEFKSDFATIFAAVDR